MALLYTGPQWGVILGILALGLTLKASVVLWLYRDVRAAGRPPLRWTLAGAFAFIPTAIVWHAKRPRAPRPSRRPEHREQERPREGDDGFDPLRIGLVAPVAAPAPDDAAVRTTMGGLVPPAPVGVQVRSISCPRCSAGFEAALAAEGPIHVTCPSCGATGHL